MTTTVEENNNDQDDEVSELAEWLAKTASRLGSDDGGTIVITAEDGIVVDRMDATEDVGSLEALAAKVYDTAARDARGTGGGTYFVTMMGTEGRFPLVFEVEEQEPVRGGEPPRFGMGGPGGPGGPGRIPVESWVQFNNQTLKHNEFLFEASIRERQDIFKLFKTQITEQHETIRFLERERARERVLIEELTSAKHLRDMELEKMHKSEQRKEKALGLLEPWMHSIGARLIGPGAIPKDVVPILQQFEAVFSTFTQEQFAEMSTSGKIELTPRQKQDLIGLFSTLINLKEQAEAQKKKAEAQANGQA